MGINVQHEEKLADKLCAVAIGETVINRARHLPLFGGIGGEHCFKKFGFGHDASFQFVRFTFAPRLMDNGSPMGGRTFGLMVAASTIGRSLAAIWSYGLNMVASQSCKTPRAMMSKPR